MEKLKKNKPLDNKKWCNSHVAGYRDPIKGKDGLVNKDIVIKGARNEPGHGLGRV